MTHNLLRNGNFIKPSSIKIAVETEKLCRNYPDIRLIILIVILSVSIIQSLFFLIITTGPFHRLCYLHRRRKNLSILDSKAINLRALAYSIQLTALPLTSVRSINSSADETQGTPMITVKKNSLESDTTEKFTSAKRKERFRCTSSESADAFCYSKMHIFTCFYFRSLCLAIILLNSVTIPLTLITAKKVHLSESAQGFTKAQMFRTSYRQLPLNCAAINVSCSTLIFMIMFSLVQLTADRLTAIFMPLKYWTVMTSRRCIMIIASGWIFSVFYSFLSNFYAGFMLQVPSKLEKDYIFSCFILGKHHKMSQKPFVVIFLACAYVVPLAFLIVAYVKIYNLTKYSNKKYGQVKLTARKTDFSSTGKGAFVLSEEFPVSSTKEDSIVSLSSFNSVGCCNFPKAEQGYSKERVKETRAAKTAICVVSTSFGLTLPYMCVLLFDLVNHRKTKFPNQQKELPFQASHRCIYEFDSLHIINYSCVLLIYLNTILTPIVYASRDGVLRRRLKSFWKSLRLVLRKHLCIE